MTVASSVLNLLMLNVHILKHAMGLGSDCDNYAIWHALIISGTEPWKSMNYVKYTEKSAWADGVICCIVL